MTGIGGDIGAWLEAPDGQRFPVPRICSIGRSRNNQLVLADMRVSRRHALIQMQGPGDYWLVDFGTVNGTRVDGRRIAVPTQLREGAMVEIAGNTFTFRQERGAAQGLSTDTLSTTATMHDVRRLPVWLLVVDIVDSSNYYRSLPQEELPRVIGNWFAACRELMEGSGGYVNQYLGDGYFGHWPDAEQMPDRVATGLTNLRDLQQKGPPHFRWVLHHGNVLATGTFNPGEESMMGPDMHFVFRMEGVAKDLQQTTLLSETAARRLGDRVALREAGRRGLKGFEGEFPFFTLS
jgi:adenylate cyclase